MMELLSRWFIRDRDNVTDPRVRRAYGQLCGFVGIGLNILLFAGKLFAGTLSGSVAITADAFNNLSDAGSSVVTLLGFRVELAKSSVEKILHPAAVDFSVVALVILAVSICVKLYMCLYNRRIGKKIRSAAMEATAADSLSDTAATAAVLLAMLIAKWTGLDIDGWVGLVVAGFILFSGVKSARETISPLLGQPPEKEFVDRIQAIVLSHPEILGLHDLVVHDYGPGRVMVSLHAEVPAHGDLLELHDVVDNIEMDLSRQLNCQAVIHMDPVVTDDGLTGPLRSRVAELVKQVDPAITIHDFRVVAGPTHTNLVFDAVVPFDEKLTAAQAAEKIRALVRTMDDGRYFAVVKVENSYI